MKTRWLASCHYRTPKGFLAHWSRVVVGSTREAAIRKADDVFYFQHGSKKRSTIKVEQIGP